MRNNPIARFVQLHRQLTTEKKHLEERFARINRAVSTLGTPRGTRRSARAARQLQNPRCQLN